MTGVFAGLIEMAIAVVLVVGVVVIAIGTARARGAGMGHDDIVVYRCTECGKISVSVGWLHAHIDAKHHGFGPWNLIPDPRKNANFRASMEYTEVLRVDETTAVDIEEVDL